MNIIESLIKSKKEIFERSQVEKVALYETVKRQRIVWLDYAKVIGLYLMIIGHQNLMDKDVTRFIFSFHMRLFFFVSGILRHRYDFKENATKVLKSLIVPFVIITSLWIVYYMLLYLKNGYHLGALLPYVLGSFISPGKEFLFMKPLCVYLWFILALAIIRLIFSSIDSKVVLVLLSAVGFYVAIYFSRSNVILPFALDSALLAAPFYVIGYFVSRSIQYERPKLFELATVLICIVLQILIGMNNGVVDICYNMYGNSAILFLGCGIMGTLMVISLAKVVSKKIATVDHIVCVLSSGSLLIVGFSAMLAGFYKSLFEMVFHSFSFNHNLLGVVIGFCVLMSFYPVIVLCQHYFPIIIGYRKKSL